jgi:hypothetical protein
MPCTGDQGLKFQVSRFEVSSFHSFWKGISTHECEHFMKVKGVNVYKQGPFPASDVMRVGFVYDQLAYRLVDCAADQNTYGKICCQELLSLLLNWPNDTQQAFR